MTAKPRRLVVVSNRVADFNAKFQTGGLAVALGDTLKASHGVWFGWSGDVTEDAVSTAPKVENVEGLTVATIDLTPEEAEGYYYGYANRCLWPALHYRLDLAKGNEAHSEIYFNVSARFADALMPLVGPDDLIWVHDYHLIPLAEELRGRGCTARIGFFLHTPFPSPEIFAAVPGQKRLGNALMVYDVVGFQTCSDRDNFRRYVAASLDGEQLRGDRIAAQGETTLASVFPIGIDATAFRKLAESESAKGPLLPDLGEDMKTIIGVDRLDYTKGLPERLRAFETLLEDFPEHRGRVRLVQVAPPTRETLPVYQEIREEVERLVGRINGRFGDLRWTPVTYLHRGVPAGHPDPPLPGERRRSRHAVARRHESGGQGICRGPSAARPGRAGAVPLRRRRRAASRGPADQSARHQRDGARARPRADHAPPGALGPSQPSLAADRDL